MMKALMQPFREVAGFEDLERQLLKNRGVVMVTGCLESQKAHLAAALLPASSAALLVAENELKAKELYEDLKLYDREVLYYPARDLIFYQADLSGLQSEQERLFSNTERYSGSVVKTKI